MKDEIAKWIDLWSSYLADSDFIVIYASPFLDDDEFMKRVKEVFTVEDENYGHIKISRK